MIVSCSGCGVEIDRKQYRLKRYSNSYCSLDCQLKKMAQSKKNGTLIPCKTCQEPTYVTPSRRRKSKTGNFFCSKSCSSAYTASRRLGEEHPNYVIGEHSYRSKALRIQGSYCQNPNCELTAADIETPESMLDVHHIDGNRKNNEIDNLQVLCVWCHAKISRKLVDKY